MLAGVPSRTPSQSSRSAAPADRAGRRTSSASSTIATPSLTASSTACRAGEGVWWTTRRRGTVAFFPVGRRRSRGNVGASADRRDTCFGGEAADDVAVAHEDTDRVAEVHAVVVVLDGVGRSGGPPGN